MASLSEIKAALLADPELVDRVPNLREYIRQYPDEFSFLKQGKNRKNRNVQSPMDPIDVTPDQKGKPTTDTQTTRKWNPLIEEI